MFGTDSTQSERSHKQCIAASSDSVLLLLVVHYQCFTSRTCSDSALQCTTTSSIPLLVFHKQNGSCVIPPGQALVRQHMFSSANNATRLVFFQQSTSSCFLPVLIHKQFPQQTMQLVVVIVSELERVSYEHQLSSRCSATANNAVVCRTCSADHQICILCQLINSCITSIQTKSICILVRYKAISIKVYQSVFL